MASSDFVLEAEFGLLDVGLTGALVRCGSVHPAVLAYDADGSLEATIIACAPADQPEALEQARRWLRGLDPVAYAVVGLVETAEGSLVLREATDGTDDGACLAIAMYAADGASRSSLYPIRRAPGSLSLGPPETSEPADGRFALIGDIWTNPFCVGDTVRFKPRGRAVDPASQLWKAIIELSKMRIHADDLKSQDYMAFLDDVRNGVFTVAGRPEGEPEAVILKPRTIFNPLGLLKVESIALLLVEPAPDGVSA